MERQEWLKAVLEHPRTDSKDSQFALELVGLSPPELTLSEYVRSGQKLERLGLVKGRDE